MAATATLARPVRAALKLPARPAQNAIARGRRDPELVDGAFRYPRAGEHFRGCKQDP